MRSFRRGRTILTAGAALVLAATLLPAIGSPASAANETVSVYLTTSNLSQSLDQQSAVNFSSGDGAQSIAININEGRQFQKMVGFGATFTDSSAWLLQDKVSSGTRASVMSNVFSYSGSDGIGLSYLRQPMSATDYIKTIGGYYTYDDVPSGQTDTDLSEFSIAHDLDYIVPILQQALGVNPDIKVQFNSWTAPAWMKTNGSLVNGGHLQEQYQDEWAQYIIKAIQAYEAQGIPIWSTSVLNEPTVVRSYPTMELPPSDSARIIRDYLAPGLADAGLATRILAADDVEFATLYPTSVIDSDPAVGQEFPAIALHGYWGDHTKLGTLHGYYPNKDVYQVELSPNGNGCGYEPILLFMDDVRYWAQTIVTWNVALNTSNGPFHSTDPSTCMPLVTVNEASGAVTYTSAFYQEGQFSKFIKPGAYRVDSDDNGDVRNLAFKNPDGSKVLVTWNRAAASRTFSVNWGGQHFDYTLAAGSIATFTWSGTPATDGYGWGNSTFGTDAGNTYGGGLKTGSWTITDADTLSQTGLGGGGWPSIYYGYADHSDFTASAQMTAAQTGTTASFPKYGMYACYHDQSNFVQAWIDPTSDNFVTHAVAEGTDLGWNNFALPGGFVETNPHTVSVTRSGDSFAFYLDGALKQTRTADVGEACQVGLVTEDYRANFDNVNLIDPLRWGSSLQGTNSANIWAGGPRRGDWAVSGIDSATITSQGSGWASLFRGYLQGDQTVSVQAQAIDPGTTSSFPKYGVYAAYVNENNYVQAWIDPTSDDFVTHAVAGGATLAGTTSRSRVGSTRRTTTLSPSPAAGTASHSRSTGSLSRPARLTSATGRWDSSARTTPPTSATSP